MIDGYTAPPCMLFGETFQSHGDYYRYCCYYDHHCYYLLHYHEIATATVLLLLPLLRENTQ